MSRWVRIAVGASPADDYSYVNLDAVEQATVIATTSGPTGFTIELGFNESSSVPIFGLWSTAAEANAALQLLLSGVDLSATVGESV